MHFLPNSFDDQFDPFLNPFCNTSFINSFSNGTSISPQDLFTGGKKFVPLSGTFEQGNFIGAALGSEHFIQKQLNDLNIKAWHTGITYQAIPMKSTDSGYLFYPKKIIDKTLNIAANTLAFVCPPIGIMSLAFKAKWDDKGLFDLPYEIVPDWAFKPIGLKENSIHVSSQKQMKVTYITLEPSQAEPVIKVPSVYEGPLLETSFATPPSFQETLTQGSFLPESYPNANFYRKIQDLVTAVSPQIFQMGQQQNALPTFPYSELIQELHRKNVLDVSASTMRDLLKNMDNASISKEIYKPVTKCFGHDYWLKSKVLLQDCPKKDAREKVRSLNTEFGERVRKDQENVDHVDLKSDLDGHNRNFSYSVRFFHSENAPNCDCHELKYEVEKTKQGVKEALEGIESDFKALGIDPDTEWGKLANLRLFQNVEESTFFSSIEDQKIREAFYTTLVAARENLSQLNVSKSSDLKVYKELVDRLQKAPQVLTQDQVVSLFDQITQNAQTCEYEVKDVKICLGHHSFPIANNERQKVREVSDKLLKDAEKNPSLQSYHTVSPQEPPYGNYETYLLFSHVDNHDACKKYMMGTQKIPHERGISEEVKTIKEFVKKESDPKLEEFVNLVLQTNEPILPSPLSPAIYGEHPELFTSPSNIGLTTDFCKGLFTGLGTGGKESLVDLGRLGIEFVKHPIATADKICDAFRDLSQLALTDQWGELCETLVPEACQLVTEWATLSARKRGELAGYVIGKLGTDFIVPAKAATLVAKGVKGANKLLEISKAIKNVENVVALETAVTLEGGTKVGALLPVKKNAPSELGKEVLKLKEALKLKEPIDSSLINFVTKNEVVKSAVNEGKHIRFITDYFFKSTKEIEKAIASFEKLVAIHQEKISNPSKFIQNWKELHPERRKALIEKKWPTEINCFTEQKNILQSILDEKVN